MFTERFDQPSPEALPHFFYHSWHLPWTIFCRKDSLWKQEVLLFIKPQGHEEEALWLFREKLEPSMGGERMGFLCSAVLGQEVP